MFELRLVSMGTEQIESHLSDPSEMLDMLGAYVTAGSARRFREQGDPPDSWPARMTPNIPGVIADMERGPNIKDRRFSSRPALHDTRRLESSVSWIVVSDDMVVVGSNLEYAHRQFFGGPSESEEVTEQGQRNLWQFLRSARGRPHRDELGWLLNARMRGQRVTVEVQARPFIGVSDQEAQEASALLLEILGGEDGAAVGVGVA